MLEAPVNRDPAGPPGFFAKSGADLLGSPDVARIVKAIEILAGEDVPAAVEKRAPQMGRQRAQHLQVVLVARVDGVVANSRGNEIVVGGIVLRGTLHAGRGLLVNPQ